MVRLVGLPAQVDEASLRSFVERHGSLDFIEMRGEAGEREAVLRMKNAKHADWLVEGLEQEEPFGAGMRVEVDGE